VGLRRLAGRPGTFYEELSGQLAAAVRELLERW
jgi:hypothetical protein